MNAVNLQLPRHEPRVHLPVEPIEPPLSVAPEHMSDEQRRREYPLVLSAQADSPLFLSDDTLRRGICLLCTADKTRALLLYARAHADLESPKGLEYLHLLNKHFADWSPVETSIREIEGYYDAHGIKKRGETATQVEDAKARDVAVYWLRVAAEKGATELHIYINARYGEIFTRTNGREKHEKTLIADAAMAIARAIFNGMCGQMGSHGLDITRNQDATILHASCLAHGIPAGRVTTHRGPDNGLLMTIRILPAGAVDHPTLEEQGFLLPHRQIIIDYTTTDQGVGLYLGKVGTGKSTALLATAEAFADYTNIITIEDPIEYRSKKVNIKQLPLTDEWGREIRSMVRNNPDVIMPSEMRDADSARAAFSLAMTGVKILSTLHTGDPFKVPERLRDFEVEPARLFDPDIQKLWVHMGLVDRLCSCKLRFVEHEHLLPEAVKYRLRRAMNDPHTPFDVKDVNGIYIKNPGGCVECRKRKPRRIACSDVVPPSLKVLDLLRLQNGHIAARQQWLTKEGGLSKARHLLAHIVAGLVDPCDGEEGLLRPLDQDIRFLESCQ